MADADLMLMIKDRLSDWLEFVREASSMKKRLAVCCANVMRRDSNARGTHARTHTHMHTHFRDPELPGTRCVSPFFSSQAHLRDVRSPLWIFTERVRRSSWAMQSLGCIGTLKDSERCGRT